MSKLHISGEQLLQLQAVQLRNKLFCKEGRNRPLLVPRRIRCLEDRLIPAVQHTLCSVPIRLANPRHFLQKLHVLNCGELIYLVLAGHKSEPKKYRQRISVIHKVVVSQIRKQSALSFELHRNSQLTVVVSPFVAYLMTLEN